MKKRKNFIFHLKIDFTDEKYIFFTYNKVYSDRSELDLSDAKIRIQNFHLSRKL